MVHRCLGYETYEAGTRLFEAGDKGDTFYILVSGAVSVRLAVDKTKKTPVTSNEIQVHVLTQPGCTFGELAIHHNGTRKAAIVTTTVSMLI
jgi:CRP-like cAMP-binding protein